MPSPQSKRAATLRNGASTSRVSTSRRLRDQRESRNSPVYTAGSPATSTSLGDKALSEVALALPHISVADVAAFASRSVEMRQNEAKSAGKVKRPLNAFMLYRKAYQNVAKTRCTRNNHQQVSSICGESWNHRESSDVVDKFNTLASLEKDMHEQAFPNYKYDPVQIKKLRDDDSFPVAIPHDSPKPGRVGRKRATRKKIQMKSQSIDIDPMPAPFHPSPTNNWSSMGSDLFPVWQDDDAARYPEPPTFGNTNGYVEAQLFGGLPSASADCLLDDTLKDPFLTSSFIDPALFGAGSAQFCESQESMPYSTQHWPLWNAVESGIPDLDVSGEHNRYLRGTEADWHVEDLSDPYQLSKWYLEG